MIPVVGSEVVIFHTICNGTPSSAHPSTARCRPALHFVARMTQGLTIDEVRAFTVLSSVRSSFGIFATWLLIALTIWGVVVVRHPLMIAAAFVLMARHQLSLGILMHDGAHRRLFSSRVINDWVGQFLCAAPILISQDTYRKLHLKHHRMPMSDADPDLGITGGYPITRGSFARKLMRDLTGQTYFKFVGYFLHRMLTGKGGSFRKPTAQEPQNEITKTIRAQQAGKGMSPTAVLVSFAFMQGVLFAAFWLALSPWYYLLLWLLPQMTVLQLLLRIRGITEHAGYAPGPDQAQISRTVVNPLQTFFFAPNNVGYHIEHHLYPSVPWYRLPKVHRLLKERHALPDANVYTSYRDVLRELIIRA